MFSHLKVKTKMILLIVGFCVALCIVGAVGLINMRELSGSMGDANTSLKHVARLSEMEKNFLHIRLNLVYMLSLNDAAKFQLKVEDMKKRVDTINEDIAALEKSDLNANERAHLNDFKEGFARYAVEGFKLAEMARMEIGSGKRVDSESVKYATNSVAPLYEKPAQAAVVLVADNVNEGETLYKEDMASYHKAFVFMVALIILSAVLSFAVGIIVSNSVTKPIARVVDMLRDIAKGEGDLTKRIEITGKDEIGELASWFNIFIDKLHSIISQVTNNTIRVASAAGQLSSTSEQMAAGFEEVAAQAGTVATAGEEMAATSTEIAQNCSMAAQGSQQANKAAMNGAKVVEGTVQVMNRIAGRVRETAQTIDGLGDRSDQIGEIIGTIEDIADQTNLLALNAAIEAARAGEQGRGFAVVADEVRALAERTTKATREIGEMISAIQNETRGAVGIMEESVKEVENGTFEAAKSGQALQEILDQINSVAMQVNQIATAAEEQTATTAEISNNIQQITGVVHETAKGAQESAHAASQLSHLSGELQSLVGHFKLVA